ncbi:MAG: cyclic nucleotide-binding domain-containing protein [Alphaproteobacteria bacterium]|nr:cyclic nucleotide-binding domain-containing protein [Alphaproteobacteria bacterium]
MPFSDIPFDVHDIAGTISYTLIALSYWLTNIYWLRVMAVVGLSFEILYFSLSGGAMHTGIAWNLVFIAINAYQIYWLVAERIRLRHLGEVSDLRIGPLADLQDAAFARIAATGSWRDLPSGMPITKEGEPVDALTLIVSGRAEVEAGGRVMARLGRGAFVGEMAFLSGQTASATVTVAEEARIFCFDTVKLRQLIERDDAVAVALHRALGRDLLEKLRSGNGA